MISYLKSVFYGFYVSIVTTVTTVLSVRLKIGRPPDGAASFSAEDLHGNSVSMMVRSVDVSIVE